MYCSVCGAGPHSGFTVYRNNPINEDPPDWRCSCHLEIPPEKVKEGIATITLNYSLAVSRVEPDQFTIKHIRELQQNLKKIKNKNQRRKTLIKFKDTYKLTNEEAVILATWELPEFKKRL